MVKETENQTVQTDVLYTPSKNINSDIIERMDKEGKNAPKWKPQENGQPGDMIIGTITELKYMEKMNDGRGAHLLKLVDDDNNPIAHFPNGVLKGKLSEISPTKTFDSSIVGMKVTIRYEGKKESKVRKPPNNMYNDFSVIVV